MNLTKEHMVLLGVGVGLLFALLPKTSRFAAQDIATAATSAMGDEVGRRLFSALAGIEAREGVIARRVVK